mmetsp:Transcript_36216/g.55622  ORF Transcript_36216/g.55622 Transcript_36216/m.55622 type:complete len:348 (-) Transcript_36216:388-1431(-)
MVSTRAFVNLQLFIGCTIAGWLVPVSFAFLQTGMVQKPPVFTAPFQRTSLPSSGRSIHLVDSVGVRKERDSRVVAKASMGLKTECIKTVAASLFAYDGHVPIWQTTALMTFLFSSLSFKLKTMLTPVGLANAMILAIGLWSTLGWRAWSLCVLYLFLGQAVTKVRFAEKEKKGIAEGRGGRRGPENVWGSAATGLACSICAAQGKSFLGLSSNLYQLGYVASIATKLADTFASEIGKAFGKTTFLITTFERVEPGTEGAVSAEGTFAALVGGFLLSSYGLLVRLITVKGLAISSIAAFLATNAESLLGATLQGKEGLKWISNEVVNFINTLIGASLAMLAGKFILGM